MGNAQPNIASSNSSSSTVSHNKQTATATNGHSHLHSHHSSKQPTSPPYSLAYYSESLAKQDLSPAFFLSSPLTTPRPSTAASSSPSFDLIAYADIARLLLSSNPTLSLWRYKLVPARISEYLFWRCLFSQLDAQHPNYNTLNAEAQSQLQPQHSDQQSPRRRSQHGGGGGGGGEEQIQSSHGQSSIDTASSVSTAAHEREIESLKAQIHSLQQQIADLSTQLQQQQTQQTHAGSQSQTAAAQSTASAHRGRWQPDKNTLEFFALDETLRTTLREQKEKRLDDVRREMRWIVDGDRVEEGPGRWECCGKEQWQAEGCKR